MSSRKTQKLGLHSWEPTDNVLRNEFNENFAKLDETGGEVQDLRVDSEGVTYPSAKGRIDSDFVKVTAQLAQTMSLEVNLKSYGIEADGTDQTSKISQAIAETPIGGKVVFPKGDYIGKIVVDKPIRIDIQGSKIIPPNGTDFILEAKGVQGVNNYVFTLALHRGTRSIVLTAPPTDIVAGDLIVVRDDTTRATDGSANVNQEVHEVEFVTGNTITIKDFIRLPKSPSATQNVYKITPIKGITIENIDLEAVDGATGNHGLYFDMCQDVSIETVTMKNNVAPCVVFKRSYNCMIDDFKFSAPQGTNEGQGYGIQVLSGTNRVTISNGYTSGMWISVDCANSFDVLTKNVLAINNVGVPFILSHNGWDADNTFENCNAYGCQSYPFFYSAQGVVDPFTLSANNIRIKDCKAQVITSAFAVGLYFSVPMVDCHVDDLEVVYGDGLSVDAGSSYGVRVPAVNNKNSIIENIKLKGFNRGVQQYTSGGTKAATEPLDHVKFKNITIENSAYAFYNQYANALHVEGLKAKGITTNIFHILSASAGEKMRYLVLKDISIQDYAAGTLISFDENARHNSGVLGEISNIHSNTTTKNNLSVAAGTALTLENILLNKNGESIRIATGTAATLATEPFPKGLVEGQRLTLMNMNGGVGITIPDGVNNINHGVSNIVLDNAKLSASYVWTNSTWVQIA